MNIKENNSLQLKHYNDAEFTSWIDAHISSESSCVPYLLCYQATCLILLTNQASLNFGKQIFVNMTGIIVKLQS